MHEERFRLFSSVECDGQLYMTPLNFLESVTSNSPPKSKQHLNATQHAQSLWPLKNTKNSPPIPMALVAFMFLMTMPKIVMSIKLNA